MPAYIPPIGSPVDEIDTPALLIDLPAMERNIERMAKFFADKPAKLRPHAKTHKCPIIAQKQLAAGNAVGITCAKLGEAEMLVAGGIQDILIANQIVGSHKIARLMGLAHHANLMVAVDDPGNVTELGAAAVAAGLELRVLVEVNIGMNRCGVEPGEPALSLARFVADTKGLRFTGLQGYEGHLVMNPSPEERRQRTLAAMKMLVDTRRLLEANGVPVEIVSGGGTGTHYITGTIPGIDEIQAGSYVFMDTKYRSVGIDFETALTVLATIISRPTPDIAVTDAGMKAMTSEFGVPEVKGIEGATLAKLSEEHGKIEFAHPNQDLKIGDKVQMIVSHGCTTINLHDRYFGIRDGRLETVWDIAGRGKSQ
ncbi:MAG: DSD1 family PLP-dependent enzyme [Chloroflexota bacterium]